MISQALVLLQIGESDDHSELVSASALEMDVVDSVITLDSAEQSLEYLFAGRSEVAGKRCVRPDIILLDLETPDLDGCEFLQRLRSHPKTLPIPVVVMAGSDNNRLIDNAYRNGAHGHLVKPASFGDIVTMLADMSIYWSVSEKLTHGF